MEKYLFDKLVLAGMVSAWLRCALVAALFLLSLSLQAADSNTVKKNNVVEFNSIFLQYYAINTELSQFSTYDGILAGDYLVDVYLNDKLLSTQNIRFRKQQNGAVTACMIPTLLAELNLIAEAINETVDDNPDVCLPVEKVIPAAVVRFDPGQQRMTIAVPQKYLKKSARGSVPPSMWQSGSTAAFVGYNMNAYQTRSQGRAFDSQYLGISSGVNTGGWYFRHNGSLTHQSKSGSEYQSLGIWAQHDITPIKGRVLIGQASTSGRLFDTLNYNGVAVFSDDQMLPESQRGYAPEIRGIARSNARVIVRQGGNIIYETTVPTGEFVINDLYPTGYGSDLDVTVRESDGRESTFQVPYASIASLLRPGARRYEAVIGKYRTPQARDGQPLYLLSWQQGITNILTLYGGTQLSNGYQSYMAGSAVSTLAGGVAFDVTHSTTRLASETRQGQSYRLSYNKFVQDTQSHIALAAYRFSTEHYLDFARAMQYRALWDHETAGAALSWRAKHRFTLLLSQTLPDSWGQLSASGISQSWWNRTGSDIQYQIGYSSSWRSLNWSVSFSRGKTADGATDRSCFISFSVPLGEERPVMLSAALSGSSKSNFSQQLSLSGTAGDNRQLSWSVSGNHGEQGGATGGVSAQYLSSGATLSASATAGDGAQTLSAGLTGAVVAHPRGVTLTPYSSDGYMVVSAPGAEGAQVGSYPGLELDRQGNAAIPLFMPYQRNTLNIDPTRLRDVEMEVTSQHVVPRAGAVTLVSFATRKGQALLFSPASEATDLPFGSVVTDQAGNNMGMVGQGGMIYVRVSEPTGRLFVTSGDADKPQTCVIPWRIATDPAAVMQRMTYSCEK